MKITKKKIGLGVAVIIALGILWTVLKPAPAEAADVDFTFGAEKKIEALKLLEKDFPNDIVIKQALSATYFTKKENTKAREYLEEALRLEPNNFSINYNLGLF